MALSDLVVEDGTGKPDADSYVSVEDFRLYCQRFGYAMGEAETDDLKAAQLLRQATAYMAGYAALWSGEREFLAQALDWPRVDATAYSGQQDVAEGFVPLPVKDACARLGSYAAQGPLVTATTGGPLVKREKIGPLETEYDNATGGANPQPQFPDVGRLLAPFLSPTSNSSISLRRV